MVGLSGGKGMDDTGRQGPPGQFVPEASFFNCSTMRLWEIRMNEGRPYLQIWREVRVSFCKIAIVCFLSVRYRLDGLYCKMAGTPSSLRVGIRVEETYIYIDMTVQSLEGAHRGRVCVRAFIGVSVCAHV